MLKPPRYILREAVVQSLLKKYKAGSFLELGYGQGNNLVLLSQFGFTGYAYDQSELAYHVAKANLKENQVSKIQLLNAKPKNLTVDYLFFFELIGYIEEPEAYLTDLHQFLSSDGKLIFSYTNIKHKTRAEVINGDMACFSKKHIEELLKNSGWEIIEHINYGYPLANWIKPLTTIYYKFFPPGDGNTESGVYQENNWILFLASLILNPLTLSPFLFLQKLYKDTEKGTGYVVVAKQAPVLMQ